MLRNCFVIKLLKNQYVLLLLSCIKDRKIAMRHLITAIILFICGSSSFAQITMSNSSLDRIEKLLLHHELGAADSLLQQENLSFGNAHSSYQTDAIIGSLFYYQEKYEDAISVMSVAISKMDSLRLWDCDNYLKTAYYIADSYLHLNMIKESETVINYALVKCVNSYSSCIYAKKLYQLLLVIYEKVGYSQAVMEQVHNEIQKIAVNTYASNTLNQDGEQIKERFMYWYDYITSPTLSREDSIYMNQGKASYLYSIGEYEEAIRLYEYVKMKLPKYDEQLHGINESLLVMYSSMAQTDNINNLLSEMYDYSLRKKLDYDSYILNVWVGHNLNRNGHFGEAQYYYQQCDSFLNTNKTTPDWVEKKKNVLSKMVFNCRSLSAYENVIRYCKEFAEISNSTNYDEHFFVNYNQAYAYSALKNYDEAICILRELKSYIESNNSINSMDYIMTNVMLGVCYVRVFKNNESIDCTSIAIDMYKQMKLNDRSLLGTLYNNVGKAYLQKEEYKKALPFLNLSADIQIEQMGKVSSNTQNYIDECIIKQK